MTRWTSKVPNISAKAWQGDMASEYKEGQRKKKQKRSEKKKECKVKKHRKKSAAGPNNARDGQSFFNPLTGANVFYAARANGRTSFAQGIYGEPLLL